MENNPPPAAITFIVIDHEARTFTLDTTISPETVEQEEASVAHTKKVTGRNVEIQRLDSSDHGPIKLEWETKGYREARVLLRSPWLDVEKPRMP